jgi:hypothetical protein
MAPLLRGSAQGPPATRGNRLSGSGTRIIYYTILKISVIWITPEPVKAANCGSSGRKRHQPDGTRRHAARRASLQTTKSSALGAGYGSVLRRSGGADPGTLWSRRPVPPSGRSAVSNGP